MASDGREKMTTERSLKKAPASRGVEIRGWCCSGCHCLMSSLHPRTVVPAVGRAEGSGVVDEGCTGCGQRGGKYGDGGGQHL